MSQKIRTLHEINKKNDVLKRNVKFLKNLFISITCMTSFISAACHGGDQPEVLEVQVAFDRELHAMFFGSGVSHLLPDSIGSLCGSGQSSRANQAQYQHGL